MTNILSGAPTITGERDIVARVGFGGLYSLYRFRQDGLGRYRLHADAVAANGYVGFVMAPAPAEARDRAEAGAVA